MKFLPFETVASGVAEAARIMLDLRKQVPYHSRAWFALNNACCHIGDGFWKQVGMARGKGTGATARKAAPCMRRSVGA